MLDKEMVVVDGGINKFSLIDLRTGQGMRTDEGMTIPIIDYLDDSYKRIERLQKTLRDKIYKYRII